MRGTGWTAAIAATALGSGLIGGVLYAFSAFVMTGLHRLPPAQALAAMNQINRAAPRGPLVVPLVGTLLACLVVGVAALRHHGEPGSWLVAAGCALYLVAFAVTAVWHIPHNDALLLVDPDGPRAADAWRDYYRPWLAWNHVRSLAAVAGSACLLWSLRGR